jgi:gliding-associated putative ABC transporter substrate-binding component GldG
MKSRKNNTIIILLVIGTFVLVNYLSNRFFARLDFTEDKRYTLSQSTKDILRDLKEPVTVNAYFSGNLPPQLDQIKREFRDLLIEYSNYSKGMIAYEFVDPLKDEKTQAQAQQAGVTQMQVQVREKDQLKAQVAFMGAVVNLGEKNEALPVIQSTSGLEYSLSSAIKKLSVTDKPVVGFIQGHGEANLGKLWQAKQALDVLYKTELVNLSDSSTALDKYRTLVIIGPTDSIDSHQLSLLDEFLNHGGRLFIAINRANAELNKNQFSFSVNTGLETWLSRKGIDVNNNLVIDQNCLRVGVQLQQGMYMPVSFPYFIKVNNFAKHPVSAGLEEVFLQLASSINFSGDSSLKYTPLLYTSDLTGTKPAEGYIDVMQQWSKEDFPVSKLTLAAAIEGRINNGISTKMIVVGDADFPVSEGQQNEVNPDNINLLVNSIDWLSDDTGLITLRTQGVTARPLDEMEDSKRIWIKYLNFLLPIVLALIYGIFRFQRNRFIRLKRMEEGYV